MIKYAFIKALKAKPNTYYIIPFFTFFYSWISSVFLFFKLQKKKIFIV